MHNSVAIHPGVPEEAEVDDKTVDSNQYKNHLNLCPFHDNIVFYITLPTIH